MAGYEQMNGEHWFIPSVGGRDPIYNIFEACAGHRYVIDELVRFKTIPGRRDDKIVGFNALTRFNLVAFTIHYAMAILRRGLPGAGDMRVQRDRKVQQQMDAELIEYHGGIRLSTLWNEKIFALWSRLPESIPVLAIDKA